MSARKPLSKKVRFDVFKRDGFACVYCGAHPPEATLEVDHIIPVREGGDNTESNLCTSCWNCNRGKAGASLTAVPKSLQEQAKEIREREAQLAGYREVVQAQRERIEDDQWEVAEALAPGSSEKGFRRDWLLSIKRFNALLPLDQVIEAAEIALANKPWSERQRFLYFCGICWRKIRGEAE